MALNEFHDIFSLAAFEGLRVLRKYISDHPSKTLEEIRILILKTEADASSLDIISAIKLVDVVDETASLEGILFYQHCIEHVILTVQPTWAKLMTLGRRRFVKKLNRDEASIFREAGLLGEPPDDETINWWDRITGKIRHEQDKKKLEQGRAAEKLTIEYELSALKAQGIQESPKWIAIEDNTAGYDVLSYSKNEFGLINKMIEVKSSIASPLRFYLSRNEWDHAVIYGSSYLFYIWDMRANPPNLFIKTIDEILPHIPADNEKGKWKNVEIPINI